jgi:hypothetical protein
LYGLSFAVLYLLKSSTHGVAAATKRNGISASLAKRAKTNAIFPPAETPPIEIFVGFMLNCSTCEGVEDSGWERIFRDESVSYVNNCNTGEGNDVLADVEFGIEVSKSRSWL